MGGTLIYCLDPHSLNIVCDLTVEIWDWPWQKSSKKVKNKLLVVFILFNDDCLAWLQGVIWHFTQNWKVLPSQYQPLSYTLHYWLRYWIFWKEDASYWINQFKRYPRGWGIQTLSQNIRSFFLEVFANGTWIALQIMSEQTLP